MGINWQWQLVEMMVVAARTIFQAVIGDSGSDAQWAIRVDLKEWTF